jgi:upstream activation factor subunit UAF30
MADTVTLQTIIDEIKLLRKDVRKVKSLIEDPNGEKAKARAANNSFNKFVEITPELREFLALPSDEQICRSQVSKRMNVYVTENNLKHPDNKRIIILDDKLKSLLKPEDGVQVTFQNIQKYLSPHYVKAGPPVVAAVEVKLETPVKPKVVRPVVTKKPKA